ncbi:MAG: crossover junction endodeoxyribonuclease RuvC [Candidatus Yonathbacteria bacterium]|nr:crossover junction endodeoxyribonuclease RuvC [Candidatus Yonathbacteria bacterium]NTW47652.1 crossover junction endodeoxyribonuclease RuvC [Candidatus Yonathbacteria bacterium]
MRILAIDPGFDRVGIAVLEKQNGKEVVLHSSCVITDRAFSFAERLLSIEQALTCVIETHTPNLCAVEDLFFAANKTTAIKVAQARGVIVVTAARAGIPVKDISPLQVKMAVTGYGRADKAQIDMMVRKTVTLPKETMLDDEMDAIAIGVTALAMFGKTTYPQT